MTLPGEPLRVRIYARVSTHHQQTLPMQLKAMRSYAKQRKWKVTLQVEEVGSGTKHRPKREELMKAARRREVDFVAIWKLDRWGRSVADLVHDARRTEGSRHRLRVTH